MLCTVTVSLYTVSFSWKALALPHCRKAFQWIRVQGAHIQTSLSINLNLWTHVSGESRGRASFRLGLFQQLTVPPDCASLSLGQLHLHSDFPRGGQVAANCTRFHASFFTYRRGDGVSSPPHPTQVPRFALIGWVYVAAPFLNP